MDKLNAFLDWTTKRSLSWGGLAIMAGLLVTLPLLAYLPSWLRGLYFTLVLIFVLVPAVVEMVVDLGTALQKSVTLLRSFLKAVRRSRA